MHATIRRYEGVDPAMTDELSRKVSETLVPQLTTLEGFRGYYLIEAGNGVFSSVGLFKDSAQSDEATKVAAAWVKQEKLESVLPNLPRSLAARSSHRANGFSAAEPDWARRHRGERGSARQTLPPGEDPTPGLPRQKANLREENDDATPRRETGNLSLAQQLLRQSRESVATTQAYLQQSRDDLAKALSPNAR